MRVPTPSFTDVQTTFKQETTEKERERDAEETFEMVVPGTKGHVDRSTSNFDGKNDLYGMIEAVPRSRVCTITACAQSLSRI